MKCFKGDGGTGIVIDESVALAWRFPNEASDYGGEVLVALERCATLVECEFDIP